MFAWEIVHRSDRHRHLRRFLQFLVDELTFCIPGAFALAVLYFFDSQLAQAQSQSGLSKGGLLIAISTESVLLLVLAVLFWFFAEFRREEPPSKLTPGTRS